MIASVDIDDLQHLSVALGAGLLIGLERGWESRAAATGNRGAGVRTFGLLGLAGGVSALLRHDFGPAIVIGGLAAVVSLQLAYYILTNRSPDSPTRDLGMTTEVAAIITFMLGAVAVVGNTSVVASVAVVTALLLRLKPVLHEFISALQVNELNAALKLSLISLVILPVLPDRDMGPFLAFNPCKIWLMVVLTALLSFAGYAAMRLLGPQRGILVAALCGGLVSSTAVSVSLARRSQEAPGLAVVLAAGTVAACATMFLRIIVVAGVLQPDSLQSLTLPLGLMAVTAYSWSFWLWRRQGSSAETTELGLHNPLDLSLALQFGALLYVVILVSKVLLQWLGSTGIYLVSAAAGMTDVDAITVSLMRLVGQQTLSLPTATQGVVIAAVVNTLVKTILVASQGTRSMTWHMVFGNVFSIAMGLAAFAVALLRH